MANDYDAQGDFKAHEKTYESFLSMFRVGTIAAAIIAAGVILLIAH